MVSVTEEEGRRRMRRTGNDGSRCTMSKTHRVKRRKKKLFLKILCMCVDMGIQVQGTMEARCPDALGQELGVVGSCSRECRESNSGSLQNRT